MNNQDIKFVPMLFSTPMVQAIFNDTKNQTRRLQGLELINQNPNDWQFEWVDFSLKKPFRFTKKSSVNERTLKDRTFIQEEVKAKAKVGDIIWCRETFVEGYAMEDGNFMNDGNGNQIQRIWYKADGDLGNWYTGDSDFPTENIPWKPSIHMKKEACRNFLKVADVRVERLQDISEDDAIGEGVEKSYLCYSDPTKGYSFISYNVPRTEIYRKKKIKVVGGYFEFAKDSYKSLWEEINGKGSWNKNPWVFVYKFDRLEGVPEGFLPPTNAKG